MNEIMQDNRVLWMAAGLSIALGVLGVLGWRWRRRREYHPGRLFRQLCKEHRLTRTERQLLARLAAQSCPEHPARIFLQPDTMARLMAEPAWQAQQPKLQDLARRLFGN